MHNHLVVTIVQFGCIGFMVVCVIGMRLNMLKLISVFEQERAVKDRMIKHMASVIAVQHETILNAGLFVNPDEFEFRKFDA